MKICYVLVNRVEARRIFVQVKRDSGGLLLRWLSQTRRHQHLQRVSRQRRQRPENPGPQPTRRLPGPRATEVVFVLKGELDVGFITTANVLISKSIKEGEIFVFPKGLVHFQKNNGDSPAAFNSQLPGRSPSLRHCSLPHRRYRIMCSPRRFRLALRRLTRLSPSLHQRVDKLINYGVLVFVFLRIIID